MKIKLLFLLFFFSTPAQLSSAEAILRPLGLAQITAPASISIDVREMLHQNVVFRRETISNLLQEIYRHNFSPDLLTSIFRGIDRLALEPDGITPEQSPRALTEFLQNFMTSAFTSVFMEISEPGSYWREQGHGVAIERIQRRLKISSGFKSIIEGRSKLEFKFLLEYLATGQLSTHAPIQGYQPDYILIVSNILTALINRTVASTNLEAKVDFLDVVATTLLHLEVAPNRTFLAAIETNFVVLQRTIDAVLPRVIEERIYPPEKLKTLHDSLLILQLVIARRRELHHLLQASACGICHAPIVIKQVIIAAHPTERFHFACLQNNSLPLSDVVFSPLLPGVMPVSTHETDLMLCPVCSVLHPADAISINQNPLEFHVGLPSISPSPTAASSGRASAPLGASGPSCGRASAGVLTGPSSPEHPGLPPL